MSRRKKSGTAVSLFAFQDVIMAVSGVIVLIMMLLTLELVQRKPVENPADSETAGAQLHETLAELMLEKQRIEGELRQAQQLAREASNWSAPQLTRDIETAQDQIEELKRQLRRIDRESASVDADVAAAEAELDDRQPELDRLAALKAEAERLQTQFESEKSDDRRVYQFPRGSDRKGWLVEISADSVAAAPLGRPQPPKRFGGKVNQAALAREFFEWAITNNADTRYYFLLIRPGGADTFHLIEYLLGEAAISYGFDVVDARRTVLDPQRGAVE